MYSRLSGWVVFVFWEEDKHIGGTSYFLLLQATYQNLTWKKIIDFFVLEKNGSHMKELQFVSLGGMCINSEPVMISASVTAHQMVALLQHTLHFVKLL